MGYDLMNTFERKCPCGKSKIIGKSYMNDWNSSRTSYELLCEKCIEEYRQYDTYWVRKIDSEENSVITRKYNEKKEEIEELALKELEEEWCKYFEHIKTKKELYPALIDKWDWDLKVERYARLPISKKRFSSCINKMSIQDSIKYLLGVMLRYSNVYQVMNKISSKNEKITLELKHLEEIFKEKKLSDEKMYKNRH